MTRPPRGLTPEEARLWARLVATVKPLDRQDSPPHPVATTQTPLEDKSIENKRPKGRVSPPLAPASLPPAPPALPPLGMAPDSHWARDLERGERTPDFTLDLHGHTLAQAHRRLDDGLVQAKAMGARLVLLITGKPRPADAADRAQRRGAIRANVLDWLAAGPHASDIAAILPAQRRHGGEGALYLVLRRRR